MGEAIKTKSVGVRLEEATIERIDKHRRAQPYEPSRSEVIRKIINDWLGNQAYKTRRRPLRPEVVRQGKAIVAAPAGMAS